jgi:hypothetical protein
MYLKPKDRTTIGISCAAILCLHVIGWLLWGEIVLVIFLSFMMGIFITIQMDNYRSIRKQFLRQDQNYKQIEALFSLFTIIKPNYPLPSMRSWAIAPDFANLIVSNIYEFRPKVILEAGCGISTLIAAYCLKEIGVGTIVSLENTEKFAVTTADHVLKHGLQDFAEVVHAPIEEIPIGQETWLWYDTQQIKHLTSIDMLIIDGPPSHIQKMARYPALPLLFRILNENAVVLLDDSNREDERKIVARWLREFPDLQCEWIGTEKGAAILRKTKVSM